MRECPECKAMVSTSSKFCTNCGKPLEEVKVEAAPVQQNIATEQVVQPTVIQEQPKKKKNGCIIALIIALVVGLIGIVGIVILFVAVLGLGVLMLPGLTNPVYGKYSCKSYSSTSGATGNYIIRINLGDNEDFRYESYDDPKNNYITGSYTYEDLNKNFDGYDYYTVTMNAEDNKIDGTYNTNAVSKNVYEFAVKEVNGKREGLMINQRTYNMYYCYEE